jgi:hypothetical protein
MRLWSNGVAICSVLFTIFLLFSIRYSFPSHFLDTFRCAPHLSADRQARNDNARLYSLFTIYYSLFIPSHFLDSARNDNALLCSLFTIYYSLFFPSHFLDSARNDNARLYSLFTIYYLLFPILPFPLSRLRSK